MSSKGKKEFILEGLDCVNCGTKLENAIAQLRGVASVSVNFVSKTLRVHIKDAGKIDQVQAEIKEVIRKTEPGIVVKEKLLTQSSSKVLVLMGLNCANCVNKIEKEVRNLPGITSAQVDFAAQKLKVEAKSKRDLDIVLDDIVKVVQRYEPNVDVIHEGPGTGPEKEINKSNQVELARIIIGALFFGLALVFKFSFWLESAIYVVSYLLVGGEVLFKAARNIARGQVFDENFLMSIATLGAFAIREFPEGVAVMLFFQVGEFFQDLAISRSRKSITALMDIRPDFANLKIDNNVKRVSPEAVKIGDIIVVKPGEKIPLDGRVLVGKSLVDTSALTGESVPREVEAGNEVLGGFINKLGLLDIEVTREFGESTVSKILDLVENASGRKAPTEAFITKFARYYTPVVVIIAVALAVIPPLLIPGARFSDWLYRALVFLVISCPCALVVSIPLGFFGGIGGASKSGVLVKGSNYLEALNNVETMVFDKTGTLTKGVFKVTEIRPWGGLSEEELLEYAAYTESYSNHPIASSILKAYAKDVTKEEIQSYEEKAGYGIKASVRGKEVFAGNNKLMKEQGIPYHEAETIGTMVHVAIDEKYAGFIMISDEVKEDAASAIKGLKSIGVSKTVMLTGDNKTVATKVAEQLGIDEVYAELLPDQKVEKLEILDKGKSAKGKLVFVGDGINDAPVLARADIGVAMGGLGSDAAIEAADVVIMTDEPSKLITAIKIAKRTRGIVWQNILFALGVKAIVLILGAGGIATMWEAVFADVGVTLIAVLNAMRVMNFKTR